MQLKCNIVTDMMSIGIIMIPLLRFGHVIYYLFIYLFIFFFAKKTILQRSNGVPFHLKND